MNYYNENEKYCVQWLKNLIAEGLIPKGEVDDRSIVDVQPNDLAGFTQCHFFAGLGGWSRALELAAWPASKSVWTGSCPCQPLSSAGQRKGHADERHLWPAFYRLISECKPPVVFGEQVASKDGREWFSGVRADLEALGYALGAADLCAAGVGAPHIRQRLWFVADANGHCEHALPVNAEVAIASQSVANGNSAGLSLSGQEPASANGQQIGRMPSPGDWWRIEPDVGRVAHGIPARVAKLRALGNAIVPQVAAEFIRAAS